MAGSDDIVKVGENNFNLNLIQDDIKDVISYARAYAGTMKDQLVAAIENLGEIIGSYDPKISDKKIEIDGISRPAFPVRPGFSALVLDNQWPDGYIPDPAFQEYGLLDVDFVAPVAPKEVDANFSWTAKNYTSSMWTALFSRTHTAILNGSYGLDASTHSAIVAREQEARRINQSREWRRGIAAVGAKGWNLAGGHAAAFLRNLQGEFIQKDQDALNNITVKDFDIANGNMALFLGNAVELEKMTRSTFDEAEKLSLEAEKAAKEYVARFFAENVKLFLGKWEGIKTKFEALKTKVEAISARNDSETKIYLGRAQTIESKIRAITEKNRGMIDARKGEIDIYSAEVDAAYKEYLALVEEAKVNQEATKAEIDRELKVEELKLTAYQNKAGVAQAISLGVAQIAGQGVASALGAINTSIGSSYSASEGRSESWGHSDSVNSSHSFKEK